MALRQSTTSVQEKMELVLQNSQQCTELLQLYLAKKKVLTFLPLTLRLRLVSRTIYMRTGGGDTFKEFND
jgi:hypothetical protein